MGDVESIKQPTYAAVVVHGICANNGSQQQGFSTPLSKLVYPVKSQAGREEFWKEAVWEHVTNAADDKIQDVVLQVMDLYDRTIYWRNSKLAKATHWWQRIWPHLGYLLGQMSRIIIHDTATRLLDLTLDLPLYLGEPRGLKIRNVVTDKIKEAMEKTDGVVLIGHSLGSVIAYDVIRENLKANSPLNIKTLITMGSPLKWVTKIRQAEGVEANPTDPTKLSLPGIRWINIYDKEDPITLKSDLPDTMFHDVENIPIESGRTFIDAHTSYWTHSEVASIVRNAMFAEALECTAAHSRVNGSE